MIRIDQRPESRPIGFRFIFQMAFSGPLPTARLLWEPKRPKCHWVRRRSRCETLGNWSQSRVPSFSETHATESSIRVCCMRHCSVAAFWCSLSPSSDLFMLLCVVHPISVLTSPNSPKSGSHQLTFRVGKKKEATDGCKSTVTLIQPRLLYEFWK